MDWKDGVLDLSQLIQEIDSRLRGEFDCRDEII